MPAFHDRSLAMCRSFRFVAVLVLAFHTLGTSARASRVDVDISACKQMNALMNDMRAGASHDSVKAALERILDTPAYQIMFRHYNRSWRPNHLPPPVFERMILSLEFPEEYSVGENQRADTMLTRWRAAYLDLPRYRNRLDRLEKTHLPELIERGVHYAQGWLPPGWDIPDFNLIVLPQGGSPAFTIEGAQVYDFFQIP